ncbi:hypothetical protein P168DRAFT_277739 [Aspergillus campestris IBT 28561]|uniref:Mid2 domain-containing protein n=1 Tax=Aspergillus campestris (strain IBT 28561) TaxID=1392248 RepID=A0A2I1DE02_ASPC2|nr:uncharacterized protein P168DRAFT_277739 [Aspergillus campestris IBT 28561]PKY08108.1 hypothetical protein P168DRAFT_277739 [Aspergillus campestris IBT 28561]
MRVAQVLLYSLSIVTVMAAQSTAVNDINELDMASVMPAPTATGDPEPTEPTTTSSSSSSKETSESSSSTSEDSKTDKPPPATTTSSSTSEDSSSTEPPTPTTTDKHESTTDDPKPTPDSPAESTSESSKTSTIKTITTTNTISGTPVPTVMTTPVEAEGSDSTGSPGLNAENKDGDSGLSSDQKKIIIGVVVGVGGAILIGAIAVVAWRIHARKAKAHDNDEAADLMSGTAVGSAAREKAPSPGAAGGTPFRSTLDQYHNPGPINTASNF